MTKFNFWGKLFLSRWNVYLDLLNKLFWAHKALQTSRTETLSQWIKVFHHSQEAEIPNQTVLKFFTK